MRTLLSLALISLCFALSAQETINYPYNPDGDADGAIASPDLLDLLGVYGGEFSPSEIQIDGVGLLQVIQELQNQIASIQLIDVNYVESTLAAHQQEIETLQAENASLTQQVQDLQNAGFLTEEIDPVASAAGYLTSYTETDPIASAAGYSTGGVDGLENYLSVDEATNTVLISGANLQVVSGAGSTNADVNGTGNIIIGYDENVENNKSGSHNLVVGYGHNYFSYGGIVVGYNNSIVGEYSSVSGGAYNTASGDVSSVSGGWGNIASGDLSSVSGGYYNTASGNRSSVSGGYYNTASGNYSSVSGGKYNNAYGDFSSVSGGDENTASGGSSSVSGGYLNTASGNFSSVSGGYLNTAEGYYSSVSGGDNNTASGYYSSASGQYDIND